MNNRIAKNASWIIVCRVVQSVLSFVIAMFSARYLGPSNYGLISYAASLVAFTVPIAQLGLKETIVDEIISNPSKEGETLGTIFGMTIVSSLLCTVGVVSFAAVANHGATETIIICALYSISLIFQMTEMIRYWFQAKLMSKYTAIVSLVIYIVVSAYKILLLVTQKSVYWFSVSAALDYMLLSVALFIIYRKLGGSKLSFLSQRGKQLFSKSKYYILSGVMVAVFGQTDKIFIKMLDGDAANGYYTVAVTCATMSSFVFQAIIDSFRPVILEGKTTNYHDYEKNLTRLYSIIIYLGLLQSVIITIFANYIVLIIYGEAFLDAVPILRIITWYSAFSYIGPVRNIWILAEQKQKYLWTINLSGAIFNIIGNIILIPIAGVRGAAVVSLMTQIFTNFILCFIVKPIRPTTKLIIHALDPRIVFGMVCREIRQIKSK